MEELRAENERLRSGDMVPTQLVDAGGTEQRVDVDIDKVQSVYAATVAAYGRESSRAKDCGAELEGLRIARQEAKTLSLQLRAAEGRVKDKRKPLDAAKKAAAKNVEAARLTQVAVEEANNKIS